MQVTGDGLLMILSSSVNVGVLIFFGKRYVSKVDKHGEILPELVTTLKDIQKNIETDTQQKQEIFNRLRTAEDVANLMRNEHDTLMRIAGGCPIVRVVQEAAHENQP